MTYPHTLQGTVTGKRIGTIEERRARFYFRPKHFENICKCLALFLRPRGGPICPVLEVPPIRATYQCAHLLFIKRRRPVGARRERVLARSEPGRQRERKGSTSETGPARTRPGP